MRLSIMMLPLVIPIAFFAFGGFIAWRPTFRGVIFYELMIGLFLAFIGLFAFVIILGLALLQRSRNN